MKKSFISYSLLFLGVIGVACSSGTPAAFQMFSPADSGQPPAKVSKSLKKDDDKKDDKDEKEKEKNTVIGPTTKQATKQQRNFLSLNVKQVVPDARRIGHSILTKALTSVVIGMPQFVTKGILLYCGGYKPLSTHRHYVGGTLQVPAKLLVGEQTTNYTRMC